MNKNKSVSYIYSLERFVKDFNLDSTRIFLKYIGNPEKNLKVIHVAGTNGKGSTSAIIQKGLVLEGYKTGLFTSPHLTKTNERIRINNKEITNKELDDLTDEVKKISKKAKIKLTFFETLTIIAIIYFSRKKVDYAVFEVGMGGRLDATNVLTPLITIITSIGKDHRDTLGKSIIKIAKEKSGIIKKNIPVITNNTGIAYYTIKTICKAKGSKLIKVKNEEIKGLKGYWKENASTAKTAMKLLGLKKTSIQRAIKETYWPGRLELVNNILLDCAHNPDGARALVKSLKEFKYENIILICGFMQKAEVNLIAKEFKKITGEKIITKPAMANAMQITNVKKHFKKCTTTEDLETAINYAKQKANKKDIILISGSIFLIGEAKKLIS